MFQFPAKSGSPAQARRPGGAARLIGSIVAAFTIAGLSLFAFIGRGAAGAKEPVQVALRPDLSAAVAAAALGADDKPEKGTGTFKGVVTFKGKPPKRELEFSKGDSTKVKDVDRAICATEDYYKDDILINEKADNAVANVVIYLREAPKGYKAPPVPEEAAVFDQKGCRFIPHVLLVRCNQKLLIKNGDGLLHNTNISSTRNPGFNQAVSPENRDGVEFSYKKPEGQPIPVKCDLHTWMKAYHLPLDHPFSAVTDENGKFEIKGLPPGKYEFYVWHEKPGYLDRKLTVEIKADEITEDKLSYTAAKFKVGS